MNFENCKHKFLVYTLIFFVNFEFKSLFEGYSPLKIINSECLVLLAVPKLTRPTESSYRDWVHFVAWVRWVCAKASKDWQVFKLRFCSRPTITSSCPFRNNPAYTIPRFNNGLRLKQRASKQLCCVLSNQKSATSGNKSLHKVVQGWFSWDYCWDAIWSSWTCLWPL